MSVVSVAVFHSPGEVRGDEIHEFDSFFETAAVSVAMLHSAGKVPGDEIHELGSLFERAPVTGVNCR